MGAHIWLVVASLFALLAPASSRAQNQDSRNPPADLDPFVGTWRANRDKSQPKLSKRDSSYTRTIAREGDDIIISSGTSVPKPSHHEYRIRCDGQFHPVPSGSLSCKQLKGNFIEGESIVPKVEHGYWSEEVSQNGQTMTIVHYQDERRRHIESVWVLDRVR